MCLILLFCTQNFLVNYRLLNKQLITRLNRSPSFLNLGICVYYLRIYTQFIYNDVYN